MVMLQAGVSLWILAHLFKRLAPKAHAKFVKTVGANGAKGIVSLLLLASLFLIVVGYKRAPVEIVYVLPFRSAYVAHAMMFVAIVFVVMSFWGGFLKHYFRHPLLIGVVIWAISHLLVNGDVASIVLFGGMWFWAIAEIMLINRAEKTWKPAPRGPIREDIRLLIIALSVYAVVNGLHDMLGVSTYMG